MTQPSELIRIRPARPTDAGTTGSILYRFQQDTAWMPKLYGEAEVIAFCGTMIDRGWMTVAERGGRVLGFLARDNEEVCALYLAPDACGQGFGRALMEHAKTASPRLILRAFAANQDARRFYLREGFAETARGDGSGNEEGLPDVTFEWRANAAQRRAA
ncbi:GNAT family N-acetyltransferase [Roseobacteraceae bacterium NS-SX3]